MLNQILDKIIEVVLKQNYEITVNSARGDQFTDYGLAVIKYTTDDISVRLDIVSDTEKPFDEEKKKLASDITGVTVACSTKHKFESFILMHGINRDNTFADMTKETTNLRKAFGNDIIDEIAKLQ